MDAFRLNALIVAAGPVLAAGAFLELRSVFFGAQRPMVFYRGWLGWGVAGVLALWGIGRNLM